MKEAITKFDLESAFKALDEIDIPVADSGIKANKPALTEIFSRKSKFDSLFEEYYDIGDSAELNDAKEAREAEVAKAKLARIEKIVDLDADSPEDLLTSYVGKYIMQCPQCMTLFYKDKDDIVESEDDPSTVNVNEVCQHCGNESGYTLIGKVGEASPEEEAEELNVDFEEEPSAEEIPEGDEPAEDSSEESTELDDEFADLDLDLDLEDDEEEKKEESIDVHGGETLVEELHEEADLEVSADEFEELINSPEFKKPISDAAARAMLNSEDDENLEESTCEAEISEDAEEALDLEEGIFDKLKDKVAGAVDNIASKLKSREAKADWIRENAMEDYGTIKVDNSGKLIPDEKNQRFHTFIVLGFKDKYANGKEITMAPSFNNKDLVPGKNGIQIKKKYEDADNIAKGWSTQPGNGPAFIYLAKDENDKKAVFLCEYFKGELENDQLEKYFEVVRNAVKGAKQMAKGGMSQTTDEAGDNEYTGKFERKESLETVMSNLDELHESSLEKLISDSLVEAYGNVAGFRLSGCDYLNEQFTINGTIYFTSGNTRKTTYTFTEAVNNDSKISLYGLNEKLGLDKQFTITGSIENRAFITESFSGCKK